MVIGKNGASYCSDTLAKFKAKYGEYPSSFNNQKARKTNSLAFEINKKNDRLP